MYRKKLREGSCSVISTAKHYEGTIIQRIHPMIQSIKICQNTSPLIKLNGSSKFGEQNIICEIPNPNLSNKPHERKIKTQNICVINLHITQNMQKTIN